MDEIYLSRINRRIQESRQRITESEVAVRQALQTLAKMHRIIQRAYLDMAEFKASLERWRDADF